MRTTSLGWVAIAAMMTMVSVHCSSPPSLSARFGFENEEGPGAPFTREFVLVADNQDNHLFGTSFFLRTKVADSLASTAIRPVQLDMYGQDMLAWTIRHHCPNDKYCLPFIHLGDAANMSCAGEIQRFFGIMNEASAGWVMAPGNHDGYFDGNIHPSKQAVDVFGINQTTWDKACTHSGAAMNKAQFVSAYVGEKAKTIPGLAQAVGLTASQNSAQGSFRDPSRKAFPEAVIWRVDDAHPQRSFVVQRIELTLPGQTDHRAIGILIDTNQYENEPKNVPNFGIYNAGLTGDIQEDQIQAIRELLGDVDRAGRTLVLFAHHPFKDLTTRGQQFINELRQKDGLLTYVSAHTHAGTYFVNPGSEDEGEPWLELNVGSILDYPPEYRTFHLGCFDEACEKVSMRSQLYRLGELWFTGEEALDKPVCDPTWEAMPKSADFYVGYRSNAECAGFLSAGQDTMYVCLSNAMLANLTRLLTAAPTSCGATDGSDCDFAAKEAAKKALDIPPGESGAAEKKLEAARVLYEYESAPSRIASLAEPVAKKRRDFRLCQAFWASKYETRERRAPLVDDWLITFPRSAP
jgi:hypothetical protein